MRTPLLLIAVLSACCLPAAASAAPITGPNLVVNGGAEADPGSVDDACGLSGPVTGWTTISGAFSEVTYGQSGFPDAASAGVTPGKNFFAGGCSDLTVAQQTVDVAALSAAIDAGKQYVSFGAVMGGYAEQEDSAHVDLAFLGAGGTDLGQPGVDMTLAPVTVTDRGQVTELLPRTTVGAVPAGTRSIQLTVTMNRLEGSANDGYVDNVSLSVGAFAACRVPKLAGLTLPLATKALAKGGCALGVVTKPKREAKGAVLVVSKAKGTGPVALTLAPKAVKVPTKH